MNTRIIALVAFIFLMLMICFGIVSFMNPQLVLVKYAFWTFCLFTGIFVGILISDLLLRK